VSNSSAGLVQLKGWQPSFQPSMNWPIPTRGMRSAQAKVGPRQHARAMRPNRLLAMLRQGQLAASKVPLRFLPHLGRHRGKVLP
jgi:hypothetical protein